MKRIRYVDGSIAGLHDYRIIDGELANWDRYRSFRDGDYIVDYAEAK